MIVVEHHAETVLTIVDKAYVLVNAQSRTRARQES
jgi:hypothetical protein